MSERERRRRKSSRSRSASPRPNDKDKKDHRERRPRHERRTAVRERPYKAKLLSKHDFKDYEALFSLYLDVQKQLALEDLGQDEVRGRWKSFIGHWNRGELAEGWYDPQIKEKAEREMGKNPPMPGKGRQEESDEESDDEIGPSLPGAPSRKRAGPAIPDVNDLALKDELREEDHMEQIEDLRWQRKQDRKTQRDQLDDIVPKAQGGTKERLLEKKQEARESNRMYREAASGDGTIEFRDEDLLGGGDGGIDDLKRHKAEMQRKKNEREIRREEILRARAQEREERMKEHAAREEKTMAMLRALAKQNFG